MSEQFKVGEICVGQRFIYDTFRNGMECEIIGGLDSHEVTRAWDGLDMIVVGYSVRWADGTETVQPPRYLRRKHPPTTGEDMIRAMFDTSPVERRQPVTAWQAQYDTAQALMKMGVCVKPGKWPMEVEHG